MKLTTKGIITSAIISALFSVPALACTEGTVAAHCIGPTIPDYYISNSAFEETRKCTGGVITISTKLCSQLVSPPSNLPTNTETAYYCSIDDHYGIGSVGRGTCMYATRVSNSTAFPGQSLGSLPPAILR